MRHETESPSRADFGLSEFFGWPFKLPSFLIMALNYKVIMISHGEKRALIAFGDNVLHCCVKSYRNL